MDSILINKCFNKTTFIIGNKKNAGKTTFMNFLVKQLRKQIPVAYLTTGIDGENQDEIFHTNKPSIITEANDYVVSTEQLLQKSSAIFEIIRVFPFKTILGRLALAKTLRSGPVELAGPETNHQLMVILDYIKNETTVETIVIDGAADRNTPLNSSRQSSFIYIAKIEGEMFESDYSKLKIINLTQNFEVIGSEANFEDETLFEISGALTEYKIATIPDKCKVLLINDFTKIFLDLRTIEQLLKKVEIKFRFKFDLLAYVIVLKNMTRENFLENIKDFPNPELISFNPYEY